MHVTTQQIDAVLRKLDIEGYIGFGAPEDEYESEAESIAQALASLDETVLAEDTIAQIVARVWAQSFNLDSAGLALRQQAFETVARDIRSMS